MGYDPEKTRANTVGEQQQKPQPDRSRAASVLGKAAMKGAGK